MEDYRKKEEKKLLDAVKCNPPDIAFLKNRVWLEKGLMTFQVRKVAWLLFIGADPENILQCPTYEEAYRDDHQIEVDVNRSFVHFKESKKMSNEDLIVHRRDLTILIRSLLIEHPSMHYYQGFHDIVEFLMIYSKFNLNWTYTIMKQLMESYLKDFMTPNLTEVEKLLQLVYPILNLRCPELIPVLKNPDKIPVVILPWILTLFSHSLSSIYEVARLFDVMLLHPILSLYVASSVVLHFKSELLSSAEDRSAVYSILNTLGSQSLPLEKIIRDTQYFYISIPPSSALKRAQKEGIDISSDSMVRMKNEEPRVRRQTLQTVGLLVTAMSVAFVAVIGAMRS